MRKEIMYKIVLEDKIAFMYYDISAQPPAIGIIYYKLDLQSIGTNLGFTLPMFKQVSLKY